MFNSTILDVAIGMIFIYLLLSLMCTAANEIIELLLKKRAIDLERGIRELLVPGSNSGNEDIVSNLYNHPLINGLFGGRYEDSRIASKLRWVARTALPSYIPASNFSLALMDLILPGGSSGPSGTTGALAPSAPPADPAPVVVNVAGGVAPAVVPPSPPNATAVSPSPPAANPSLTALRNALLANPQITDRIKQGLVPLMDAAGNDMARVRENIEGWYNASMDRVSSWYKRRAQVTILILGLFIAITINVDTVTIAKRLSTDKALRESLVAAADAYAKANATASPEASPAASPEASPAGTPAPGTPANSQAGSKTSTPSPTPTPPPCPTPTPLPPPETAKVCAEAAKADDPKVAAAKATECARLFPACSDNKCKGIVGLLEDCVTDPESEACRYARSLVTIQECRDDKNSPECKRKALLAAIPACKCADSPQCKYEVNKRQLESLGLPIGWASLDDPQRRWPGANFSGEGGWWDQIYWHGLGWLLTALALSLGAPFWFDLLNKFIVIRSAVKPHEKSPEKGSKG